MLQAGHFAHNNYNNNYNEMTLDVIDRRVKKNSWVKNWSIDKMADAGDELVDIGELGIPGGHPAHLLVVGVPIVEE